ncbi:hypothetical protein BC940DRAFT_250649 [Gongronella butleri]|nr:hypothetical protein BC940DRAFT_250649 [Gongronella butleri]
MKKGTVAFDPEHLDAQRFYAFRLPDALLSALVPVQDESEALALQQTQEQLTLDNLHRLEQLRIDADEQDEPTLSCRTCAASFDTRDAQRSHFASDWHRYNIKRKADFDQPPVTLAAFDDMLADLSDSLSGSEEDDDDDDDDDDDQEEEDATKDGDKVKTLMARQQQAMAKAKALDDEASALAQQQQQQQQQIGGSRKHTSMIWYTAPSLTSKSFHLGIYRLLVQTPLSATDSLSVLRQCQSTGIQKPRYWVILMMGGGHFAGAVIDAHKSMGINEQQVNKQVHMHAHKTFHRYTTRRKQGGAQSANDSGKGKAKSAGAQIRRYNELALQQDIRQVLDQWKDYIAQSATIIVHAPSGNKKMIYGYEGAVLRKDDPRVHGVPFTTRRPTLNEIRRVYLDLTTVKVMEVDTQALMAGEQAAKDKEEAIRRQLEKSRMPTPGAASAGGDDAKRAKKKTNPVVEKLVSLVNQGKEALLAAYVDEKADARPFCIGRLPEEGDDDDFQRVPTLLHLGAQQGHAAVVALLLRELDADPTIKNDQNKTAYEVAKDKTTRNAFRRCMHDYPGKWDWLGQARVPSALSAEQEQEQLAKDAKKKAKEDAKRAQVEEERARREQERERLASASVAPPKQLSGRLKSGGYVLDPVARALRDNQVNTANLSPEAKMRLEREKRARAAEERMRRLR